MTAARKIDPVLAAFLNAPLASQPETDEERAAFEEGMADIRAGRVVSHESAARTVHRMKADSGE